MECLKFVGLKEEWSINAYKLVYWTNSQKKKLVGASISFAVRFDETPGFAPQTLKFFENLPDPWP